MTERERFKAAADLFLEAGSLPANEVGPFLDGACGDDTQLRSQVQLLLDSRDDGSVFQTLAGQLRTVHGRLRDELAGDQTALLRPTGSAADAPSASRRRYGEQPGDEIGGFRLLELIGEGGFGRVWVAEQRKPVDRRVALKVIKAGMDTRQVVARFEQERQALAVMDHPNIAKVFEAGATETGRPYFVMELCKGEAITDYCDSHSLTIAERLELFAQVCLAVQHAHARGIIHRDIKPGNVLVATQDGKPHAKVIDFGIAKATGERLTEKTLFTEHRQLIGTPEYMSPEQAEGSLDIDTRTDVYSLGVLLYELLTGTTPFSGEALRSAAYAEIQRIIREIDPPKPSTRLGNNSATIQSVAAKRNSQPKRLGTVIRGELDWIVMKALEKDRQRRYESASGLANDVRRYLTGEAVNAAPPSTGYLVRKFIRRNRVTVSAGAVIAAALVAATAVSVGFGLSEARQREEAVRLRDLADANATAEVKARARADANAAAEVKARARAEAISKFVTNALQSSNPMLRGKQDITVAESMASAIKELDSPGIKNDPEVDAALRATIGDVLRNNAKHEQAEQLLTQALSIREAFFKGDHPDITFSLSDLANLYKDRGELDKAVALYTRASAMMERTRGPEDTEFAKTLNSLAGVYYLQQLPDQAEPLMLRALAVHEKTLGPTSREVALTLNDLGLVYKAQGKYDQAEPLLRRALAINESNFGPDHPDVAAALNSIADVFLQQSKHALAEPLYVRALGICEKALPPDHPIIATALLNLATVYRRTEQFEKAEPLYLRSLAIREKLFGPDHDQVGIVVNHLGLLYRAMGRMDQAEPFYVRSVAIDEKLYGPDHPQLAYVLNNIGDLYQAQKRYADSEAAFQRALSIREKAFGLENLDVGLSLTSLAMLARDQGHMDKAESLLRRALEIYVKAKGPDDPDVGQLIAHLAAIHHRLGRSAEARQGFDRAIEIWRLKTPEGSPFLARMLWRSARIRIENNTQAELAGALTELEEALPMAEKFLQPAHSAIKEYRQELAKCKAAIAELGKADANPGGG